MVEVAIEIFLPLNWNTFVILSFQVVGSSVSLLVISPHLTGLTLLCVPSVVVGGTFIGSLLRKLSREAQTQVCIILPPLWSLLLVLGIEKWNFGTTQLKSSICSKNYFDFDYNQIDSSNVIIIKWLRSPSQMCCAKRVAGRTWMFVKTLVVQSSELAVPK